MVGTSDDESVFFRAFDDEDVEFLLDDVTGITDAFMDFSDSSDEISNCFEVHFVLA